MGLIPGITEDYIKTETEQKGPESKRLAEIFAQTISHSRYPGYVRVISPGRRGLVVLKDLPENATLAVHSDVGDPSYKSAEQHAASLIDRLVEGSTAISGEPVGFANVIDWNRDAFSTDFLYSVGQAMAERAISKQVACLNGERANLGHRVPLGANVSGTMVTLVPDGKYSTGIHTIKSKKYIIFKPEGKAVYLNSDGIGTKTEFYERNGDYTPAPRDSLAMKADDANQKRAMIVGVSDIAEYVGAVDLVRAMVRESERLGKSMGFYYSIQPELAQGRWLGYKSGAPVLNVSGTAVSVIDEELLKQPLGPKPGEYVIAIRGHPNSRSNGITTKRKLMTTLFGEEWHTTEQGKHFMPFLAAPSIIFYPLFRSLLRRNLASDVMHMSGGAHHDKLAGHLAELGLFSNVKDLFPPDSREQYLAEAEFGSTVEAIIDAYKQWPMGNDGFITTAHPEDAMALISAFGLEARVVGRVEPADGKKRGAWITAYEGSVLKFPEGIRAA